MQCMSWPDVCCNQLWAKGPLGCIRPPPHGYFTCQASQSSLCFSCCCCLYLSSATVCLHLCAACSTKQANKQVLAYLRVCVSQALAAFRSCSPASIAGLPDQEQQLYALRFMREYMSQAWFDKLAASYGNTPSSLSEFLR